MCSEVSEILESVVDEAKDGYGKALIPRERDLLLASAGLGTPERREVSLIFAQPFRKAST